MKTYFKEKIFTLVERGDVLVLKDGRKLLVVHITLQNTPWSLINIDTMDELNVYKSLAEIKDSFENDIARIIKQENLEIVEVE